MVPIGFMMLFLLPFLMTFEQPRRMFKISSTSDGLRSQIFEEKIFILGRDRFDDFQEFVKTFWFLYLKTKKNEKEPGSWCRKHTLEYSSMLPI